MSSLEAHFLNRLVFTPDQIASLRRIGELQGRQELFFRRTPETLKALQGIAIIESTESSNRLEGITAPRKRLREIMLQSTNPENRSEQEIAGYRDALALIHGSGSEMRFTTNVILQCHSILYRYLPQPGGSWKMTDNLIVERNPDGSTRRIRFRPVSAVQTPGAMEVLVNDYNQAISEGTEPLVVVPLAILDFLCVHPFSDGNGRIARLLTLLLLYHFNYQAGRFISLERVFEESRDSYYETLEKSSQGWHESEHDVSPWLNYFWGVLLRAYGELEDRVGTLRGGKGSKTEQIKESVSRKVTPFAISDIEADCPGVSRDMIRLVLRSLRDEGKIELRGKGRGSKWIRVS
jgi:Fic family protein